MSGTSCSCPRRPLTLSQQGIWFAYLNDEHSVTSTQHPSYAYHLALEYHVDQRRTMQVDSVVRRLLQENVWLRTQFDTKSTQRSGDATMHTATCAWIRDEEQRLIKGAWSDDTDNGSATPATIKAPFDLGQHVPWRIEARSEPSKRTIRVILTVHHLVCDGYALAHLHRAIIESLVPSDEPVSPSQKQQRHQQRQQQEQQHEEPVSRPTTKESHKFWHTQIDGVDLNQRLASNRFAEDDTESGDNELYGVIDLPTLAIPLLQRANELPRTHGVSVFSLCCASYWRVLRHMAGLDVTDATDTDKEARRRQCFPIGVSFRASPPTNDDICHAANAMPVCFDVSDDNGDEDNSIEAVKRVQEHIRACKTHECYDAVQLARDLHRGDALFRNNITVLPAFPCDDHSWLVSFNVHLFIKNDLMLVVVRGATRNDWHLRLIFNARRYTRAWARRLGTTILVQMSNFLAVGDEGTSASSSRFHPLLRNFGGSSDDDEATSRLLHTLQSPTNTRLRHLNLWEMVRDTASLHGKRDAVMQQRGATYTYTDLMAHVTHVSRVLSECVRDGSGVVAILGGRSYGAIVCMLAVAKARLVYMCVDVETLDAERAGFMVSDSEPVCIIDATACCVGTVASGNGISVALLREHWPRQAVELVLTPTSEFGLTIARAREMSPFLSSPSSSSASSSPPSPLHSLSIPSVTTRRPSVSLPPSDAAYLMYTSGTTGKPKGVFLTHDGLCSMLIATQLAGEFHVVPSDRVLLFSSISFDASVWHIFVGLISGACVCVPHGGDVLGCIAELRVTVLDTVPSVANTMEPVRFPYLRVLQLGAEACPTHLAQKWTRWATQHPSQNLIVLNSYGPTEAAVMTHSGRMRDTWTSRVAIGRALDNVRTYVLDARGRLVVEGAIGRIWVAGPCVAPLGYWRRPELTTRSFRVNPFADVHPDAPTMYDTGDIGRWIGEADDDRWIECLGRRDHQVKWHGCRVELAYLEQVAHRLRETDQDVSECCAVFHAASKTHKPSDSLVVYVSLQSNNNSSEEGEVARRNAVESRMRSHFERTVASYMMPSHFLVLPTEFARTSSDKIDRSALPVPPFGKSVSLSSLKVVTDDRNCRLLAEAWSTALGLDVADVIARHHELHFFEVGGSSLQLMVLLAAIKSRFSGIDSIAELYQRPSFVQQLEMVTNTSEGNSPDYQQSEQILLSPIVQPEEQQCAPIHIVACEGVFPVQATRRDGLPDLDAFWTHLLDHRAITARTKELAEPINFVPSFGRLDESLWLRFAHETFQLSRKEATNMDPQQRILIECTLQALLQSDIATRTMRVGTFVAISDPREPYTTSSEMDVADRYQAISNNVSGTAATRLAYTFNLRGPAVTIQTACSSFGVALDAAVRAIRAGTCEAAVVGAVSLRTTQTGHTWHDGMIFSRLGQCRPFEHRSDGITIGNACGVIILEASHEERGGIRIIRTCVNNDGRPNDKISFTAPSVRGEIDVMSRTIDPVCQRLAFVEAHGTGTKIGDPIEMHAIAEVVRAQSPWRAKDDRVLVSATKANVGHCDTAAGFIGVAKALLCLRHALVPAQPDFDAYNSVISARDLEVLEVAHKADVHLTSNQTDVLVNCFGIGGSNASALLRRDEVNTPGNNNSGNGVGSEDKAIVWLLAHETSELAREWLQLLLDDCGVDARKARAIAQALSIRTYNLDRKVVLPEYLTDRLTRTRGVLVWSPTARVTDADFIDQQQQVHQQQQQEADGGGLPPVTVAFCFTGQGHLNIAHMRELYDTHIEYQRSIDETFLAMRNVIVDEHTRDLLPMVHNRLAWYNGFQDSRTLLDETQQQDELLIQWLGFAHGLALYHALTRLDFAEWSTYETWCVGHSLGEYAARVASGHFDITEALFLIAVRAQIIQRSHAKRKGIMVAVMCSAKRAREAWSAGDSNVSSSQVSIGAINGPEQIVLSASSECQDAILDWCKQSNLRHQILSSNGIAYHSHVISDTIHAQSSHVWLDHLRSIWKRHNTTTTANKLSPPSTSSTFFPCHRRSDPDHFTWMLHHVGEHVDFMYATRLMQQNRKVTWIEIGDRAVLTRLISQQQQQQQQRASGHVFIDLFPRVVSEQQDDVRLLWNRAVHRAALHTNNLRHLIVSGGGGGGGGVKSSSPRHRLPCFPLVRPTTDLKMAPPKAAPAVISVMPRADSFLSIPLARPRASSTPGRHFFGSSLSSSPRSISINTTASNSSASSSSPPSSSESSSPTMTSMPPLMNRRSFSTLAHEDLRDLFFCALGMTSDEHARLYPDPNFIQLGGDSMSAIALLSGFRKLAPMAQLTTGAFLARPTLSHLLELLSAQRAKVSTQDESMMETLVHDADANAPHLQEIVCLVPPVGATLTLYRDYLAWFRREQALIDDHANNKHRSTARRRIVLGFRYNIEAGRSVATLAAHYWDQLSKTLASDRLRRRIGSDARLIVLGISYGGLIAQYMFSQPAPVVIPSLTYHVVMIDTPTPDTVAVRDYRRREVQRQRSGSSSNSITHFGPCNTFDAFKYTFVDMFEVAHPTTMNESTMEMIENEIDLAHHVCRSLEIDPSLYDDLAQQARIFLQDVNVLRGHTLPESSSKLTIPPTTLFVCSEPRAIDPQHHEERWSALLGSQLDVRVTPGHHISMNYEPILSQHILTHIFPTPSSSSSSSS